MKKYLKTVLIPVCMVLALTCFTACSKQANKGNTQTKQPDSKPSFQSEVPDSDEEQPGDDYQEQEYETDPQQLKEYYSFISKTFRYMLAEKDNCNIAYAPVNFYMSLSMLGEMAGNEAGKELQDALGYASLDKHTTGLQNMVNYLKEREKFNKEGNFGRLNLDNSFWLQDALHYQEAVMDTLQKKYSLEVFKGDFQNPEFQKQMENWVYEKTNHSLQPQFNELVHSTDDNAFCIISTLDYFGEWASKFKAENTKKGIFYCEDGKKVKCEFMNQEFPNYPYIAGDGYISTDLSLMGGRGVRMYFILPDETKDVRSFWTKNRLADILSAWGKDVSKAKVKFSVPKFSCSSKIDLKTIAEKMQLKQLFNPSSGAFASFSDAPLKLTDISQETSISIDEIGCSLASLTGMVVTGAAPAKKKEVKICLDRPFYYILCKDEIPFLIGMIDNPVKK
ncbi:MAG: hypothetical protein HFH68_15180 [Lachnospiraceae bacterium]|nr:hypothetical protein [Lachnospiraceae bacterium]